MDSLFKFNRRVRNFDINYLIRIQPFFLRVPRVLRVRKILAEFLSPFAALNTSVEIILPRRKNSCPFVDKTSHEVLGELCGL